MILFWTFYFIPFIATVIIAVTINKTVAITDLNDERAMPQIPCPLVHPLATFVPIPTSSPAAIINGSEFVIRNGISFVVENENIKKLLSLDLIKCKVIKIKHLPSYIQKFKDACSQ